MNPAAWSDSPAGSTIPNRPSDVPASSVLVSPWHNERVEDVEVFTDLGSRALALDSAGRPHIAYGADSFWDGTAWLTETVDSAGNVGQWTSLALDSAGRPHISYLDVTSSTLRYAYHDGTDWQVEPVDTGSSPSLALDGLDRPHIAYASGGNIRYAYYDGTMWITTTVAESDDWGGYGSPSLALDANGRPHVSYGYGYKVIAYLLYSFYDGTAWQSEVVDGQYGGWDSSLALDAQNQPHISYQSGYGGTHLRYARRVGTSWLIEPVDDDGFAGYDTSLVLDSAGRPHISYGVGYPSYELRYARHDGPAWTIAVVDSAWYASFYDTSLALDENDRPHISYHHPSDSDLKYACFDGAAWRIQVVDSRGSVGTDDSLALDAAREPHISYHDGSNGDLKYAYHTCAALGGADIAGPARLPLGVDGLYTATYRPITATYPLYEWNNGTLENSAIYSWTVTGTHAVAVTATNSCSQVQGALTVTVFCQEVTGVAATGPHVLLVGQTGHYLATPQPITASRPLTLTWDNGAATPTTTYSWATTGTHTLTVTATNVCGNAVATSLQIEVLAAWPYHIYLPLARRTDPSPGP